MTVLAIPVAKAGGKQIEVDTDQFPAEIWTAVIREGLKVVLNARMSKITTAKLEGDQLAEAQASAYAKAEENLTMLYSGKLTKTERGASAKVKGTSREVVNEAMRLARGIVKDMIRAQHMRVSAVAASDITAGAKLVLEGDPSLLEQAKENLARRNGIKPKVTLSFTENPKLAAKAAQRAEAARVPVSAKQAGRVAPRRHKGSEVHA